jgi:hypothetical protein
MCALLLASCGGTKEWQPEPVTDPKLAAAYPRILVLPVNIDAQLANDYPQAATDCRAGLVVGLETSKRFQVQLIDKVSPQTERGTLIVKLAITDARIVSRSARTWGGQMVGSSYINAQMTLTDGHTGQMIRDKEFSTYNNPWAASMEPIWTDNIHDKAIPHEMGHIIGDYITAVIP